MLTSSLAACGSTPPPSLQLSSPGQASDALSATPDLAAVAAALAPVLDPDSRDLLALIEPEETIEATIDVADPKLAAANARSRGLDGQVVSDASVLVIGLRDEVAAFAAGARATHVTIAEDHRPDRWLPAVAPSVRILNSGFPYRLAPLPVDRSGLHMTDDHATALVAELARAIVTIDGRPYQRLTVDGECDPGQPPVCDLRASGVSAGAGGSPDDYLVVSDETTTGNARFDSGFHQSVPRVVRRAAEWIARHDAAAAIEIAAETGCCGAMWDPSRPGVVTIDWTKRCSSAVAEPPGLLADTGTCLVALQVVVDVGRGVVLTIDRGTEP